MNYMIVQKPGVGWVGVPVSKFMQIAAPQKPVGRRCYKHPAGPQLVLSEGYRRIMPVGLSGLTSGQEIKAIIARTEAAFWCLPGTIAGPSKQYVAAYARQVAIYAAHSMFWPRLSLNQIAIHFGGRDHSTIHYAAKKIRALVQSGEIPDPLLSLYPETKEAE